MSKRIVPLSDVQINKAKPGEKAYKLYDGFGLALLVTPKGGKLWRFRYHFNKRSYDLTFGAYPDVSLLKARQKRDEVRRLVADGIDPAAERRAQIAKGITFREVTLEWHARFKARWSVAHAEQMLARLERDVFPFLGDRPIAEISPPEVLTVLRRIEMRTLETAHRMKIACGQICRYAVATGLAERDPVADLKGALPPIIKKHMAAPTDPQEFAGMLRAIKGFTGSFIVKSALLLAPMLFVRPGELRSAEWEELDLDNACWNIPAEKMKSKRPHLVPLPHQAVSILKALHPLTGSGRFVFPCHRTTLKCMSENAVNAALRRMGFEKNEITGHGFRATARTLLHEVLQFDPYVIEAQLAHAVPDKLGRAYNRTLHRPERIRMMQVWADYLDEIIMTPAL